MKVDPEIIEKAKSLGVLKKLNLNRTIQIKKKLPKYLIETTNKNELVILGNGELTDFYNQPLAIIPLNDYLAQLVSVRIQKQPNEK